MPTIEGRVLIAQEGRLQVVEPGGAAHLFVLDASAAAETSQMHALQDRQAKVRVTYDEVANVIGLVATRIELLEPEAAR
jgi:hypothetical protein